MLVYLKKDIENKKDTAKTFLEKFELSEDFYNGYKTACDEILNLIDSEQKVLIEVASLQYLSQEESAEEVE